MKRASWVLRAISALAVCAGCCSCSFVEPHAPPSGTIHITNAQLGISSPGNLQSAPPRTLRALPEVTWTAVTLPHALPRALVPKSAISDLAQMESMAVWYRIELPATQVTSQLGALYLPRWHTFGHLSIYVDRTLIYNSLADGVFGAFNDPLFVQLPVDLADAQRPLELLIRTDSAREIGGAVSSIWLGPPLVLKRMYDIRRMLQNRVPQITSSIFLVLGAFALAVWARRRHEITQLQFFVLSVLFYIRNLHYYIDDIWIPDHWFSWLTVNSLGWLDVVVYFFAFNLYGQRYRLFERILVGAMLVASALTLPLGIVENNLAMLSPLAYLIFTGVSFGVAALLSIVSWRARSLECGVLAAILWLNLFLGVHDWMLQNWRSDIESVYLLPFGVLALFAMFLTTVLRRYLAALTASEKASAQLEARLAEREQELRESYGKLREVEQAQLLSQERQRLMREMHDGLGSALMSSLIAVERGQMQTPDIVQVLRECVDDLKLTIDSLEPVGDDLLLLLATLRYRLEGRLQAAGIQLVWAVEPVPNLSWLNPALSLHILRIVQEILTNVLKHAHAKSIRVAAIREGDNVVVAVEDDGVGFDVAGLIQPGRGLANMRQRAALLGATLEVESRAGATRVCLRLPIRRSEVDDRSMLGGPVSAA